MIVQCVCCPVCCRIKINGEEISGNRCGRGYNYAKSLLEEEDDYVYGKIRIDSQMVSGLPVKTDKKVAKVYHQAILKEIFDNDIEPEKSQEQVKPEKEIENNFSSYVDSSDENNP